MTIIKKTMNSFVFTTLFGIFFLINSVYPSIIDEKCDYYCNVGNHLYGNSITKNYEQLTLGEYVQKMGDKFQYYFPCCDGRLKKQEDITIVSNSLEIVVNATVGMNGDYEYMDTESRCTTYCAIDLKTRTAYFKYNEGLTLKEFVEKYSDEYNFFTYCCNGHLDSDRMTVTSDLNEFNLSFSFFKINKDSMNSVEDEVKDKLTESECDFYCNIKDNEILSIKKSDGKCLKDYATDINKLTNNTYDSFTNCCDGKIRNKVNAAVYHPDDSVTLYEDLKAPILFDFKHFNKKCTFYCAFNEQEKIVTLIETSETILETAKSHKNYNYFTYCCKGRSDIKGNLISIDAYEIETAVDTRLYAFTGVLHDLKNKVRVVVKSEVKPEDNSEEKSQEKSEEKSEEKPDYLKTLNELDSKIKKFPFNMGRNIFEDENFESSVHNEEIATVAIEEEEEGSDSFSLTSSEDNTPKPSLFSETNKNYLQPVAYLPLPLTHSKPSLIDAEDVPLSVKKTTFNWRCGSEYGRCPDGFCCSKYGYCGKSDIHCKSRCRPEYGVCY